MFKGVWLSKISNLLHCRRLLVGLTRGFFVSLAVLTIAACSDGDSVTSGSTFNVLLDAPTAENSNVLLYSDLQPRVTVGGVDVPMTVSPDNRRWQGTFILLPAAEGATGTATLDVVWHKLIENVELPLVSASPVSVNLSSDRNISLSSYLISDFDYDSDGNFNIDELAQGTNPLIANVIEFDPSVFSNITEVFYNQPDANGAGVFRYLGNDRWAEYKINSENIESLFASFVEVNRAVDGILIYDSGRNLSIRFDIFADKVYAGQGTVAEDLLFPIADPPSEPDVLYEESVAVYYNPGDENGAGVFRFVGESEWTEHKIDINTGEEALVATYGEVRRDEDGILLYDAERDLSIRLDITTGQIFFGTGDEANTLLFPIVDPIDPNLPPVDPPPDPGGLYEESVAVYYNPGDENGAGVFRFVGESEWTEHKIDINTGEETLAATYEEVRRDEDGILLYDAGRDLSIRLDITTDQIFFGTGDEANTLLFPIVDPIDPNLPPVDPPPDPGGLYEESVAVYYNPGDENGAGVFRFVGESEWTEYKIDINTGEETLAAIYEEVRRDEDGILLYDAGRDLSIRLDITTDQIFFGTGDEANTLLFPIVDGVDPLNPPLDPPNDGNSDDPELPDVDPPVLYPETVAVFYNQPDENGAGVFRAAGNGQWTEYKIDRTTGEETLFAVYAEIARDTDGILLFDDTRDLSIRLDITGEKIFLGSGTSADVLLFPISDPVETLPQDPPGEPPGEDPTNDPADTVPYIDKTSVFYNEIDRAGVFRFLEDALWVEYKIDPSTGEETDFATYTESQRDDDGILIVDADRDLSIRLAIDSGQILLTAGDTVDGLLLMIAATVKSEFFYQPLDDSDEAHITGVFRLENTGEWVESQIDESGAEVELARFVSVSQNAEQVVFYDVDRDLTIRLDLLQGGVFFGDGLEATNSLYRIVITNDQ